MPLGTARKCKTKKCRHKVVSANISELKNANKSKPRSERRGQRQIIAIAMRAAYGTKKH